MKKTNYLIFALVALAAAFLLYLWYHLGFNHVDNPVDLTLGVVWFVGIALLIALVVRQEKKRQQLIRTVYVAPSQLFNSEAGVVELEAGCDVADSMAAVLAGLKYGFKTQEQPKQEDFDYRYVVRTESFKDSHERNNEEADGASEVSDDAAWKGTVVKIDRENGNVETQFETAGELRRALQQQ